MNARPAERSDISRLQDLTQSKYDFGEYLELPNYRALVVEDGNLGVVGFSVMHIWRWNRSGQIAEVFIDPRHRNRGYGTLLIRELLDLARQEQLRILFDHVSPDEPGCTSTCARASRSSATTRSSTTAPTPPVARPSTSPAT